MTEPAAAARFDPAVHQVLEGAGWTAGRQIDPTPAVGYVCAQVGRHGARLESFEAATAVLAEFGELYVVQDGPGTALRRRPFAIEATQVAATAETLTDFGRVLGTRLFPIGMEGDHEAYLAVDESGRIFALDPTGEWYIGESIDAALTALITGAEPSRVDDDGRW